MRLRCCPAACCVCGYFVRSEDARALSCVCFWELDKHRSGVNTAVCSLGRAAFGVGKERRLNQFLAYPAGHNFAPMVGFATSSEYFYFFVSSVFFL